MQVTMYDFNVPRRGVLAAPSTTSAAPTWSVKIGLLHRRVQRRLTPMQTAAPTCVNSMQVITMYANQCVETWHAGSTSNYRVCSADPVHRYRFPAPLEVVCNASNDV
jgi:hypothetical protein